MPKKEIDGHVHMPKNHLTFGQKAADILTGFCGSWIFILIVSAMIVVWIFFNMMMLVYRWDPYPFIILNLVLSCIAALISPVILMSQNREAERDRLQARYDYLINRKAEKEIKDLHKKIDRLLKKRKK